MASLVRKQGLDKFYTNPDIVSHCMEILYSVCDTFDLSVEPSAGNGAFLEKITGEKIGLDILPENENIVKMDFFDYTPSDIFKNILVIGNPPFGKCSSTAINFFNHAAKWATFIAFIVPKTFKRTSVQNRLDLNFHLIFSEDLPLKPCCFSVNIEVKCCFQIWKRQESKRKVVKLPTKHSHWSFVNNGPVGVDGLPTPPPGCDFAIRAYGGKCGEIKETGISKVRAKSWHFIKANDSIEVEQLIKNFMILDYSVSKDTARQNSIGRADLVHLYTKFHNTS